MTDNFKYDVFLSHSSRDKEIVRAIAQRLRKDKLRVWFDEWEIRPGDNIPHKIEDGLELSRVLVLCMSVNAFGSDWAQLESGTFRFRDPLNKERRFIPLRLDNAPIKGSLAQFLYLNWLPEHRAQEYAKLLEACRPHVKPRLVRKKAARKQTAEKTIQLLDRNLSTYAFSVDGKRALVAVDDHTLELWDLEQVHCLRVLKGHTARVKDLVWSTDQRRALSCSADGTLRLWEVETGRSLRVLQRSTLPIDNVAWSADQSLALSISNENTLSLWDVETGLHLSKLEGHTGWIYSVAWSSDQQHALSGSSDATVRLWEVKTGRCLRVLEGHTGIIDSLAWSPDNRRALSAADDRTLRLWDVDTGRCLRVIEGPAENVDSIGWGSQRYVLVGAGETVRLWDLETGRCLRVFEGHSADILKVEWHRDQPRAFSGDSRGNVCVWDLSDLVPEMPAPISPAVARVTVPDQVQYTNAKVLLVGDSGVGKTRSVQLPGTRHQGRGRQTDPSTDGAWATHWPLSHTEDERRCGPRNLALGFRRAGGLPPRPSAFHGRHRGSGAGLQSAERKSFRGSRPVGSRPAEGGAKTLRQAARRRTH